MSKKILFSLFLPVIFVFSSCGSLFNSAPQPQPVQPEPEPQAQVQWVWDTVFWRTTPEEGLVFIGVSPVLSKEEDTIKRALEDAARKVSIYNSLEGQIIAYTQLGSGTFDFQNDVKTAIVYDQNYDAIIEALEFDKEKDLIKVENSVFLKTRYIGGMDLNYLHEEVPPGQKPAWIDNPPEIPGFYTGVGYAERRALHGNTVNASFEAAILDIIKNTAGKITGGSKGKESDSAFGNSALTSNALTAHGTLKGFYVLDVWMDPVTKAVYTLAVCREAQAQYD